MEVEVFDGECIDDINPLPPISFPDVLSARSTNLWKTGRSISKIVNMNKT
jgi:hypothetical protein